MAGGKETPRQKMIGMMYLVLTALLALNVSKSILDAFVAIEENTQKSNISQYEKGNLFYNEVNEEFKTTPDNAENKLKRAKLQAIIDQMDKVNKLTGAMIEQIDNIKLDILEKSGEDIKTIKDNEENVIIWKAYDKKNPCVPIRMNLMAVQAKDQYDVPMHEIIGEDIKNPNKSGKKLWDDLIKFRSDLVSTVGTYDKFSIKPKAINDYKSNAELVTKVKKEIESSKADLKEDAQVLQDIYINLTKPERVKVHDMEGVHWIGFTFDHSPLVAAVASLSSIQQDILSARALALAHLKSKVSTGEYSFNKIVGLAYGPMIANTNDEVELKVMMAAFDSDNQPTITYGGTSFVGENGQGVVKVKVTGGPEMNITGKVSIKNKSGVAKTEDWNHKIIVMKPQGTVSLPEMNMLYEGYPNKVEGVASGYDQTVLSGSGVVLTKSGNGYIGSPNKGNKTCTITVSGKNSVDNKTVSLGTYTFRVSKLPPAQVSFGNSTDGMQASKVETRLFARYPPEIPLNVTFTVLNWELEFMGRSAKGSGNILSAEAQALLKQAKPGAAASFIVGYKGPDNLMRKGSVTVKL
jgi:gliding motility-associated protein GldM